VTFTFQPKCMATKYSQKASVIVTSETTEAARLISDYYIHPRPRIRAAGKKA